MENMPGSFAIPSRNDEITIFRRISLIENNAVSLATIDILEKKYGIVGHIVDKVDCESPELGYDIMIECLLGAIFHHILSSKEWFTFSIDGQTKGVFAKVSTEGASLLDVVAVQGFTMSSDGNGVPRILLCDENNTMGRTNLTTLYSI